MICNKLIDPDNFNIDLYTCSVTTKILAIYWQDEELLLKY